MKQLSEKECLDLTIEYLTNLQNTSSIEIDNSKIGGAFTFGLTYALAIKASKKPYSEYEIDRIGWKYYSRCGEVLERNAFTAGYLKATKK